MTIQEAMHTAIAGGYHMQGVDGGEIAFSGANNEYSAWTRIDTQSSFLIPVQETLLDPAFWRALGCALGWSEVCDLTITCAHGEAESQSYRGYYWMYQWHCFIQPLANGYTPATFFARLLNASSPRRRGRVRDLTRGGCGRLRHSQHHAC